MFLSRLVILVAVLTNLDVYIPAVKTCNLEHENDKKKKKNCLSIIKQPPTTDPSKKNIPTCYIRPSRKKKTLQPTTTDYKQPTLREKISYKPPTTNPLRPNVQNPQKTTNDSKLSSHTHNHFVTFGLRVSWVLSLFYIYIHVFYIYNCTYLE